MDVAMLDRRRPDFVGVDDRLNGGVRIDAKCAEDQQQRCEAYKANTFFIGPPLVKVMAA